MTAATGAAPAAGSPTAAPAAPAPRYEFDAEFQKKIAALAIRDTQFSQLTEGLVKPEYFENVAHAALIQVVNGYYAKYKKAPGDKTVLQSVLKDAARTKLLPVELLRAVVPVVKDLFDTDVSDREYVADQVAEFARNQAVTNAILASVELVEKRDFERIGQMVRKAIDVGVNVAGNVYDYADMIKARTQARKDRAAGLRPPTGITTGFPILDDYLYHKGWGRRELAVIMGGPKAGKSMAMIGFSVAAIAAGYKTLYVTLEVSKDIISERIDANISERAMFELGLAPHEVEDKVTAFMAKAAPLKIAEFPSGSMKVSDLRRLIEHYKAQGLTFDFVVLDYADLMAPERMTDNLQENSKSIYVNLRGLAMQEDFAMLTGTQTNREGAKKAVATMTDVAEDLNKIRIADIVISINTTPEERSINQARLFFAAVRNGRSGFTLRIEQQIDQAKFISKVVGED